jgi:hypothetical protein
VRSAKHIGSTSGSKSMGTRWGQGRKVEDEPGPTWENLAWTFSQVTTVHRLWLQILLSARAENLTFISQFVKLEFSRWSWRSHLAFKPFYSPQNAKFSLPQVPQDGVGGAWGSFWISRVFSSSATSHFSNSLKSRSRNIYLGNWLALRLCSPCFLMKTHKIHLCRWWWPRIHHSEPNCDYHLNCLSCRKLRPGSPRWQKTPRNSAK